MTPPLTIDPRYGYTEQTVPSSFWGLGTIGVYYTTTMSNTQTQNGNTTTTTTATIYPATNPIFHTIGWANEYEQGAITSLGTGTIEPWNYFVFNDRDYTSVAELMLVPGSPPGLFTKQFVEFAPSWNNVANIFAAVQPQTVPLYTTLPSATTTLPPVTPAVPTTGLVPYLTASTPLAMQYGVYLTGGMGAQTPDLRQPETYPYLIDKFFYTGYGQTNTLDFRNNTGGANGTVLGTVGGYASDGWFKMFEFFEVPSQAYGAIGPVQNGFNFDWARQDAKPGLLNLNLIMDEEVFFSVAGSQTVHQANGQYQNVIPVGGMPTLINQIPSDQFTQNLLNFSQLVNWVLPVNGTSSGVAPGSYTGPLNPGTAPIPLVVTSTLANGAPGSTYPIVSYPYGNNALVAGDPTYNGPNLLFSSTYAGNPNGQPPPQYTNAMKAAFAEFLSLRHGGSGYMFGWGTGAVGQNVAVATGPAPNTTAPVIPGYNGLTTLSAPNAGFGLPMERPFHSLSYPDIDFTVMRPAALPPSAFTTITPSAPAVGYANNPFEPTRRSASGDRLSATPACGITGCIRDT